MNLKAGMVNGAPVIYRQQIIFNGHHGYVPQRIGRLDGNPTNDRIANLYDMAKPTQNLSNAKWSLNNVEYREDGTLWSSNGEELRSGHINGRCVVSRSALVFAMHHGYVPKRIGRLDGDRTNDDISNLIDLAFGKPIDSVEPVKNDKLLRILRRYPDVTDQELAAIRRPLPDHVRQTVLDFFRQHGVFVPIDEMVVDKATGGVKIRRFIIEHMEAAGDLCYEEGCFRSTSVVT